MKRFIFVILVFLFHSTCFGQASLAAYSGEKLIGWLLSPNGTNAYYLTPSADILSLDFEGRVINALGPLTFTNANCEGQEAYVSSTSWFGEILRNKSSDLPDTRFFKVDHGSQKVEFSSIYELRQDVGCQLEDRYVKQYFPVTFVDPIDYGIQYIDGTWKIQIDRRVLERPDNLFCNGFESCPTQ